MHRLAGGKRQPVYAYRREIDEWFKKAGGSGSGVLAASTQPRRNTSTTPSSNGMLAEGVSRRSVLWVAVTAILLLSGFGIILRSSTRPVIQITGVTQLTDNGTEKLNLVTDGKQLYFSEEVGDEDVLSAMAANGGPIRKIPLHIANPQPEDITADGKFLLVLSRDDPEEEHRLWIVPTDGKQPFEISRIKCSAAAWSPNGQWIAVGSGNTIYLVSRDNSYLRPLAKLDGLPETLRWSPDGKDLLVLCRHLPESSASLWRVDLDGGLKAAPAEHLQITDRKPRAVELLTWAQDGYFSVSNDSEGEHLLYFRWRPWWRASEFEASALSTKFKRIDALTADSVARRLFVISGGQSHGELARYDLSTRSFTMMLPGTSATFVDMTKNLALVTYVKSQDSTLWVSRTDGMGKKELSPVGMMVELPRWSPDGEWIAFMGKQPNRPWRIFIIPAAGGTPKEASQGDDNQGAPTWSPDGNSLVYGNLDCQGDHTCGVHKIDLASGKITTLPGSQGLGTARLSPDGQHIAALSPALHKLYVFDVGQRRWRVLADGINGNDVSWSSDSRFIYTKSSMSGQAKILRVAVRGDAVETVLNLGSFSEAAGELDVWFALTPDNALLLNRWLNASEIYALNYQEH